MARVTDRVKARTLTDVSKDLLKVIEDDEGLILRQNNNKNWMGIALPCRCDQQNAPFPTFQNIPGTPEYRPIAGRWHDPNKCNTNPLPFCVTNPRNEHPVPRNGPQQPRHRIPIINNPCATGSSVTLPSGWTAAVGPAGNVMYYAPNYGYHVSYVPTIAQAHYTGMTSDSGTQQGQPGRSHMASVTPISPSTGNATTGAPFDSSYNMMPYAAANVRTDGLPTSDSGTTGRYGHYQMNRLQARDVEDETQRREM
ncbi:hypothetical protein F5Y03DRAFT_391734 [Xylaria venustula]|nr:hypothetical protein F5Y03DRAFT_391734 [Xylaria venustula]